MIAFLAAAFVPNLHGCGYYGFTSPSDTRFLDAMDILTEPLDSQKKCRVLWGETMNAPATLTIHLASTVLVPASGISSMTVIADGNPVTSVCAPPVSVPQTLKAATTPSNIASDMIGFADETLANLGSFIHGSRALVSMYAWWHKQTHDSKTPMPPMNIPNQAPLEGWHGEIREHTSATCVTAKAQEHIFNVLTSAKAAAILTSPQKSSAHTPPPPGLPLPAPPPATDVPAAVFTHQNLFPKSETHPYHRAFSIDMPPTSVPATPASALVE
jgi:hypothetical protein